MPAGRAAHSASLHVKQTHEHATNVRTISRQAPEKGHAKSAGAALEAALTKISDTGRMPGSKIAPEMSGTLRSTLKSTCSSVQSGGKAVPQLVDRKAQQAARLASTKRLEKDLAERAEHIRAENL